MKPAFVIWLLDTELEIPILIKKKKKSAQCFAVGVKYGAHYFTDLFSYVASCMQWGSRNAWDYNLPTLINKDVQLHMHQVLSLAASRRKGEARKKSGIRCRYIIVIHAERLMIKILKIEHTDISTAMITN